MRMIKITTSYIVRMGMQGNISSTSVEIVENMLARIKSSMRGKKSGHYTYVIGNNGTGKSRLLRMLAKRLEEFRSDGVVACISSTVHDRFNYGDHERVRYMGARNSTNAVFLSAVDRQLSKFILQAMQIDRGLFKHLSEAVSMNISFVLDEKAIDAIQNIPEKSTRNNDRMIKKADELGLLKPRSIAMLRRIAKGDGYFEFLTEAQIPMLLNYLDLNIDFSLRVELSEGELVGFGELSTGEQNRLLFFAKVLSAMHEGATFLVDEPEISLHLHWQMEFHSTLAKLLSRLTRYHVIIATHSPIIISEAVKADSENVDNVVAVLHRPQVDGQQAKYRGPGSGAIICKMHSFVEVASHDQLVLRYFQTSPYQTREVSVEVADAVLSLAEGESGKLDALKLLSDLRAVIGLSKEAERQIDAAIKLVNNDLVGSIKNMGAI